MSIKTRIFGQNFHVFWVSDSTECHIQLTMREKWPIKIYSACRQALSLTFVASYAKSQPNGKLLSLHLKREYVIIS
jgi:hypothetical protein